MISPEMKAILDKACELEVYCCIEECGGIIWRLEHDMADERIPKEDWPTLDKSIAEELRPAQQYAISILPKFGVAVPLNDKGSGTPEYWAWYRWWNNHMKGLSDEEWKTLEARIKAKDNPESWDTIVSYRPSGDWQSLVKG